MSNKNENLQRLLQQFVDASQAGAMADDIRYADAAFDAHPAPPAPKHTTAAVKQNVRAQLTHRQNRQRLLRVLSSAAAMLLVVGGWLLLHNGSPDLSPAPARPVGQANLEVFYTSDASAADLDNDISQLLDDVEAIETAPYEPVDTMQINLNEIEDQLMANSTEFWKG